jgi:two-component system NarL family response regulator
MPELNGIEAARQLREISPRTRVIALSAYTDEAYIRDMIDAGVVAYIIKSGAAKDLIQAIRTASRGRVYFSQEIMGEANQVGPYGRATGGSAMRLLSQREREILQLIAEGNCCPFGHWRNHGQDSPQQHYGQTQRARHRGVDASSRQTQVGPYRLK